MSNPTTEALNALLDVKVETPVLEGEVVESSALVPAPANGGEALATIEADPAVPAVNDRELEDDFQRARKNIADMIKNVSAALDSAIILAQSGDSPRAYEVVGGMLERLVNANKELVSLHGSKKETLQKPENASSLLPTGTGAAVNIEKAVFVGRASDLLREVKRLEKEVKTNASES